MKIATLGPEGTFSHEASLRYNPNAQIIFVDTIWEVFEMVSKLKSDIGVVPIENSVGGTVGQTLDCLMEFELKIIGEELHEINHYLAAFGKIGDIKSIYAHPQTYEQCHNFIKKNLPKAEIIQTSSNGKSAEIVAISGDKSKAAIIPKIAADIYKMKILKNKVEDCKFNVTRFFILGTSQAKTTGKDRTSIAIKPNADRPGLLLGILSEFAKRNINLTKIESRPTKTKIGNYVFFIDFEGHKCDSNAEQALKKLGNSVKVFGSYSRKY